MACDLPVIPPKLEQARQLCTEANPNANPELAAMAVACAQVWEKYKALRLPYEQCLRGANIDKTQKAIEDALK